MAYTEDLHLAQRLYHLYKNAETRGIECELTFKKLKQLTKVKKCYFTGIKFDSDNKMSIDRIDNSKGYIDSNVVACTEQFNKRKGNLSIEEITQLYKGIKKHLK